LIEHPKGESHASRPVPCCVDAFHPKVGIAPPALLECFGIEVAFDQTCRGQLMTNSAYQAESAATDALFVRTFPQFHYIVGPSGQLVGHGIAGS
jgi:L-lactate dehydrogenase complex protein LldE